MGQRHQLFAIARVGKHYRCLAAVHCQWLFGEGAVRACLNILSVFSDPANRIMLKAELGLAADFYKNSVPPKDKPDFDWQAFQSTPVAFPFIASCVALGLGFDPTGSRAAISTFILQPPDMGFDGGDNNDGITIFDITDLESPRYCFTSWSKLYNERPESLAVLDAWDIIESKYPRLNTPWTASEYMRCYAPQDQLISQDGPVCDPAVRLDKHPLVKISSLASVWPWGKWEVERDETVLSQRDDDTNSVPSNTTERSLLGKVTAKLLDYVLSSGNPDLRLFEDVINIPDFRRKLQHELLMARDRLPGSPALAGLLKVAYSGNVSLDCAVFRGAITPDVLHEALSSDELSTARDLTLCPDWEATTPTDLANALCESVQLRDLYVIEQPARRSDKPGAEMFVKLAGHPRCPTGRLAFGGAFAAPLQQRFWLPTTVRYRPPPQFPVVQLIMRHEPYFPKESELETYYFGDSCLTATRFAHGLLTFFRRIMVARYPMYSNWGFDLAIIMARAASLSSRDTTTGTAEISQLAPETFTAANKAYRDSFYWKGCFPKLRDLEAGYWTVIMEIGNQKGTTVDNTSYAFVRTKGDKVFNVESNSGRPAIEPEDLEIVDVKGFLRTIQVDSAELDSALRGVDSLVEDLGDVFELKLISGESVCEVLREAIDGVPEVRRRIARALDRGGDKGAEDMWYPELDLANLAWRGGK